MFPKNIENKLKKHSKFHKKLMSFNDLESFELFEIEHVIDTYFDLKDKLPYLKINILSYNNFNDFYKAIYYISHESKKDFFKLNLQEKKVFLMLKKIDFEILNEYLIVKPKNYQEVKTVSSDKWCIRKETFYNSYHKNNEKLLIFFKGNHATGITYSDKSFIAFDQDNKKLLEIDPAIKERFNIPEIEIEIDEGFSSMCAIILFASIPLILTFILEFGSKEYAFQDMFYGIMFWGSMGLLISFNTFSLVANPHLCLNFNFYKYIILSSIFIFSLGTIKSTPEKTHYEILYKNHYFSIVNPTNLKDSFNKDETLSYIKINKTTTKDNLEKQISTLKLKYRFLSINDKEIYLKILDESYKNENRGIINYLINNIYPNINKKNWDNELLRSEIIYKIIHFNDMDNITTIKTFKEVDNLSELIKSTIGNADALIYYIENMKMTELQLASYHGVAKFYKNNEAVNALIKKMDLI
jgi:hypothetical protein